MRFAIERLLRTVGQDVLAEFAGCFRDEWAKRQLPCPVNGMERAERESTWTRMVLGPEDPPDDMVDALLGVRHMGRVENMEQMRRWVGESGAFPISEEMSPEDVALRYWLWSRDKFREKHAMMRIQALTAFVYFVENADVPSRGPDRPDVEGTVKRLTEELDAWYEENGRGTETAVIREFKLNEEVYFAIRHGDTFARVAGVKRRELDIIGYRPAKDDLVIFNPQRMELRINARTLGEEELYRRMFGAYLMGQENYFVRKALYDLSPLREDGAGALHCRDVAGLKEVLLVELEVATGNAYNEVRVIRAADVCKALGLQDVTLEGSCRRAQPVRAVFDLMLAGGKKVLRVEMRPPEDLKIGPRGDVAMVQEWLRRRRFRVDAVAHGQGQ